MKHVLTILSLVLISSTVFAVAPRPRDICPAVITEGIDYTGSGPGITISTPVKTFSKSLASELEKKAYKIVSEAPQSGDYSLVSARSSVHSIQAANGEPIYTCFISVTLEIVHDKRSEEPVFQPRVMNLGFQSDFSKIYGCDPAIRAITKQLPDCYK